MDDLLGSGGGQGAGPSGGVVEVEFRRAWQMADPEIERDAKAFWARLNGLAPGVDPNERAKELVAVAYLGERLVAVETASIATVPALRCRLAVLRCIVGPGIRERNVSLQITNRARLILQRWSLENPDEQVMGIMAVLDAPTYNKKAYPPVVRENGLSLVGFTPDGRKIMVAWFDHALI